MKEDNKFVADCMVKGCKKDTYSGARGMCINHYSAKSFQVKVGNTTWSSLEKEGLARPKLTNEECAIRQKHPHRMN